MTIETASYIADLDPTYPTGSETNDSAEGDNHIRLIKTVVLASFPNITGAVTATHDELNAVSGLTATASELNKLDGVTVTTAELNRLSGVTSNIQTQLNTKVGNPTQEVKDDSFTAVANYHYILRTNSTRTVTMPASPSAGDLVWITNTSGGNWTVDRNGSPIMGAASNDTSATNTHREYTYIDSTTGWARIKSS